MYGWGGALKQAQQQAHADRSWTLGKFPFRAVGTHGVGVGWDRATKNASRGAKVDEGGGEPKPARPFPSLQGLPALPVHPGSQCRRRLWHDKNLANGLTLDQHVESPWRLVQRDDVTGVHAHSPLAEQPGRLRQRLDKRRGVFELVRPPVDACEGTGICQRFVFNWSSTTKSTGLASTLPKSCRPPGRSLLPRRHTQEAPHFPLPVPIMHHLIEDIPPPHTDENAACRGKSSS